jgi:hypothetical protein
MDCNLFMGGVSVLLEVVTDYWWAYGTYEIQTDVLPNLVLSQM